MYLLPEIIAYEAKAKDSYEVEAASFGNIQKRFKDTVKKLNHDESSVQSDVIR